MLKIKTNNKVKKKNNKIQWQLFHITSLCIHQYHQRGWGSKGSQGSKGSKGSKERLEEALRRWGMSLVHRGNRLHVQNWLCRFDIRMPFCTNQVWFSTVQLVRPVQRQYQVFHSNIPSIYHTVFVNRSSNWIQIVVMNTDLFGYSSID